MISTILGTACSAAATLRKAKRVLLATMSNALLAYSFLTA